MKAIFDIGNTTFKCGLFSGTEMVFFFRENTLEEVFSQLEPHKSQITSSIVATVRKLSVAQREILNNCPWTVLWFTVKTPLPMKNSHNLSSDLGVDRLAAVVEAVNTSVDRPILIIDVGTAVTYEFISAEGVYLGGNISPGIQLRFKALSDYTSALPLIDKDGPRSEIGINTDTAIRNGVLLGLEHEIMGYIHSMRKKESRILVFLTGGDSISFDDKLKKCIFADKFLVLRGLNRILDYNNDK
ncbi:MAG: type III pantothenate kinase [Bacteroidaceae bacterium]